MIIITEHLNVNNMTNFRYANLHFEWKRILEFFLISFRISQEYEYIKASIGFHQKCC